MGAVQKNQTTSAPMLQVIARAEQVVSLGGYNTTCEILSLGIPALIIPRTTPRIEQLIRAERMCELGLLDTIRPEDLDVEKLSNWLRTGHCREGAVTRAVDFGGFRRISELVGKILSKADQLVHN